MRAPRPNADWFTFHRDAARRSVADRDRARPCAADSLSLWSPRHLSSRERREGVERHAAGRPALDFAAGAFRDPRVVAESGTAERTVEAELAQHRQRVGG